MSKEIGSAIPTPSLGRLYKSRPDKNWGLTDGISFVVMAEEEIHEAFTYDRHFQQAGYTCLLEPTR